jgi:hypothetical protein
MYVDKALKLKKYGNEREIYEIILTKTWLHR